MMTQNLNVRPACLIVALGVSMLPMTAFADDEQIFNLVLGQANDPYVDCRSKTTMMSDVDQFDTWSRIDLDVTTRALGYIELDVANRGNQISGGSAIAVQKGVLGRVCPPPDY